LPFNLWLPPCLLFVQFGLPRLVSLWPSFIYIYAAPNDLFLDVTVKNLAAVGLNESPQFLDLTGES
jgi:hypothetical protein